MWLLLLVWELHSHCVLRAIATMKRSAWLNYKVMGGLHRLGRYTQDPCDDDGASMFYCLFSVALTAIKEFQEIEEVCWNGNCKNFLH